MKDLKEMVNSQRLFFSLGSTRELTFRRQQLVRLKTAIEQNESLLLDALKKDLQKHPVESYMTEVGMVLSEIRAMLKHLERYTRPRKVKTPLAYFGGSSRLIPEPLGVVLIIAPWNYPFLLLISPLVGAIAAGNCAVLKPSELSPCVSSVITKMISEAFSPDYILSVEGDASISTGLLEQKFDHIFFTGSTAIGKKVMEAAASNLTPVTLELGGKSPCIVHRDADLQKTAQRLAWGKFVNAGQTCVAPDYLYVHTDVKEKLIFLMKETISRCYGTNPRSSECYPRIVSERHFDRLIRLMEGEKILLGGTSAREEKYIAPTLLELDSLEAPIMQEEIFGPILPILEYRNLDTVMAYINSKPKPLALYIFTKNNTLAKRVLNGTSSGGVCVNDVISHITIPSLPFGGVGESGIGSYHGKASFETFSHIKPVFHSTLLYDNTFKYPPYRKPLAFFRKIMKLM